MERAKDRIYGPVERKVRVYGGKEFDRHGWMCDRINFYRSVLVGIDGSLCLIKQVIHLN